MSERTRQRLFADLNVTFFSRQVCPEDFVFSSISTDSRTVEPAGLFVAIRGETVDGHDFLIDAVEKGACAVLCNTGAVSDEMLGQLTERAVCVIAVADTAAILPELAARYYGYPAKGLRLVGITGTNGKTTVAYLTEQVLLLAGQAVGVIGTVNNRYCLPGEKPVILPTRLTTPEPLELQRVLRQMADAGVQDVVMEVSSHALAQNRVGGLFFSVAAFTNLSRDHLDYHGNMQAYLDAKSLLFRNHLKKDGVAVLPENENGRIAAVDDSVEIFLWGRGENAAIQLQGVQLGLDATEMDCRAFSENFRMKTALVGEYNLENILVAWGICKGLGVDNSFVAFALSRAEAAPGRVERVSVERFWAKENPVVLVDYAHTPDALEKILQTVAALPHRNLCVVFGCGGDRDGGKRAVMGDAAARFADVLVVTDDNPRTEEPNGIIAAILDGVEKAGCPVYKEKWLSERKAQEKGCVVLRDRAVAISSAIQNMGKGDIVVIAGKGHEPYQITAEGRRFFDDRRQAANALFSWSPTLLASAAGGVVHGAKEQTLGAVTTDSRSSNPQGIFVALKGEKHDGHHYLEQAVQAGNICLVVERVSATLPAHVSQILVSDTLRALGDLAAFRRSWLVQYLRDSGRQLRIIGITGSCGKTSVKEMTAAIFRKHYPVGESYPESAVLKTVGNFNNLVGLPLSLLPLGVDQEVAVLEMGMNVPGEIARLSEIAGPSIRCITNIHGAHLEGLGSVDGVAAAKGELFAAAREDDILIVNLDDERVVRQAQDCAGQRVKYSLQRQEGASLWAENVTTDTAGCCHFFLCSEDGRAAVQLAVAGEHNVVNALCAAAIGLAAGVPLDEIAAGLAAFRAVDRRMEVCSGKAGFTLINDCYNANPASMAAALRVLASLGRRKSLAVLGDMLELGSASEEAHRQLGRLGAELGIQRLAVVGGFAEEIRAGALSAGLAADAVTVFADKEALGRWLLQEVQELNSSEDAVLVKASRGLALESIVCKLL